MKQYKQCGLTQDNVHTVGWIETRGARIGAKVEIDGVFWEVVSVGDTTLNADALSEIQRSGRDFKRKTDY